MLRGNRTLLYRRVTAWTVTSILNGRPAGMQSRILSWRSCSSALTSVNAFCIPYALVHCSQLSQGLCQHTITDKQSAVPGQCQRSTSKHNVHLALWLPVGVHAWELVHTRLRTRFPVHQPSRILKLFLSAAAPARVPVLVVGAGPTGLTLSTLLGKLDIPNLVLDAATSLPNHPQVTHPCDCHLTLQALLEFTLTLFAEVVKAAICAFVMW